VYSARWSFGSAKKRSRIVGQLFNIDIERVFGHVRRDYAMEVFQEMYDATLLEQKMSALRLAQAAIAAKKQERTSYMDRLDRMANITVGKFGSDYDKPPVRKPDR
jgi:hypothetical protein